MQCRLVVEAVDRAKRWRRWLEQRLLLVVFGLVGVVLLLVVSGLGLARSLGFVMSAAHAVGDLGQIAPEQASPTGAAVTPGVVPSDGAVRADGAVRPDGAVRADGAVPPNDAVARDTARPVPSESPPAANDSGGAPASQSALAVGGAPAAAAAPAPETTGAGGAAALASSGGSGGAAPSFWDNVAQRALDVLTQNTISMCGPNTCNNGQVCCNASCGLCVARGSTCDQTPCAGAPRPPTSVRCGSTQCNDGQVCCNASCGICKAPGESCDDQPCP